MDDWKRTCGPSFSKIFFFATAEADAGSPVYPGNVIRSPAAAPAGGSTSLIAVWSALTAHSTYVAMERVGAHRGRHKRMRAGSDEGE